LLSEQMFAAGARKVLLPFGGLPEIDNPDDLRVIDARKHVKHDLELMTVHIMSTCKMAATPETGPCDGAARLRGYSGLVVADASAIPSSVGVNPMETIVALTLRNADRWCDDLLRGVV